MWIYPGMNMRLFIQEEPCKMTCCLLSKRIFPIKVSLDSRCRKTIPSKNEGFKNVTSLYENAMQSKCELQFILLRNKRN